MTPTEMGQRDTPRKPRNPSQNQGSRPRYTAKVGSIEATETPRNSNISARKAVHAFNMKEWHGVDVEHYGRRVQWNEKPFIFKATEGRKVVGTISGKYKSEVLTVDMLIVAKKERGKGIGKILMEKAEAFGRKMGARKAHLETGKDWTAAKFYKKLGYKKIAVLPKHNFGKDFIVYSKFLK